jgi:outer membrane protein assembly factor BamA
MPCRLAQIVVFATACLFAGEPHVQAQSAVPEVQSGRSCPASSASNDKQPSGAEISIAEVSFSGALQMATSDQDQIAASTEKRIHGNSVDEVTEEALERVRAGWQDQGYFKVQVSGEARTLTSSPAVQRIAILAQVDEGAQYSLGAITFKHNKAIRSVEVLRGLFPINDGDIFSREKITKGLENEAFGELGYINFTSIPNTTFDDEKKLISFGCQL